MMSNTYYKAVVNVSPKGLVVGFQGYVCIHDTPTYAYCINDWLFPLRDWQKNEGESDFHAAKRLGVKVYRIHKTASRFAFAEKQDAFQNLRYRKTKHLQHLRNDIKVITMFLDKTDGKKLENLIKYDFLDRHYLIQETEEIADGINFC